VIPRFYPSVVGIPLGYGLEIDSNNTIRVSESVGGAGGGISDGDKGDITVSASGATWTIDSNAVTTAKIANSAVTVAKLSATGSASASTVLSGAGSWMAAPRCDMRPKPLSTMYLSQATTAVTMQTAALTAGTIRMSPVIFPWSVTIDQIAYSVTTASATGLCVAGIYGSDSNGRPTGSALVTGTSQSNSTTGNKTDNVSYTLDADTLYWFAIHCGTANVTTRAHNTTSVMPISLDPSGTVHATVIQLTVAYTGTLPTIPTITTGAFIGANPPAVYVRIA
jgi:hypothetical protein